MLRTEKTADEKPGDSPRRPNNSVKPAGFAQSPLQPLSSTFQYVGETSITAVGPTQDEKYRFGYPGGILQVDPRDRASLAAVPNLRKI
jgi:hypothetical protein